MDSFTYAAYRQFIRDYLAKDYHFGSFADAAVTKSDLRGLVLLRHDIDFDIATARAMAEIEADEGVQATYFFLLRTKHYNVLSKEDTADVRKILDLGHHLGLHFDCGAYPTDASSAQLAGACQTEVTLLRTWFGCPVEIVSYHRPSPLVLTGDPELSAPLPHTYTARFTKDMRYCSDSRGEWHYGDPRGTPEFAERMAMHILIHPIWWNQAYQTNVQTLECWLKRHVESLEESMAANCAVYRKREAVRTT